MGSRGNASARANRAILFLALVLAFAANAWAQVSIPYTRALFPVQCQPGNCYYVDGVNGSDNNDGTTLQTAWKTLQQAADAAPGGATVLVANGVYTNGGGGSVLYIAKSGTSNSWTTFAALPGNRPIVQVPKGTWTGIGVATHHVLIDGFEIVGRAQSMTLADGATITTATPQEACIGIVGSDVLQPYDVIIRNSVLHDCPGGGILHFAADSVFILYNHIYNNGWYNRDGDAGINIVRQVDSAGSANVGGYRSYVVGNLLDSNWNYLAYCLGAACIAKICDGSGIIIDSNQHSQTDGAPPDTGVPYTGRTYVANNIVSDSGASGINAYVSSHVDFVNNTTYNNLLTETCDLHGEITVFQSSDVNVINNVAINLNGKWPVFANSGILQYNIWSGILGIPNQMQLGPHDIQGDPGLIAPSQGVFTPAANSPALRSGTDFLAPAVDFFGNPRAPGWVDRGAVQVSGPGPDLNQHGLTGSWYEAATSGQGVEVEVFPDMMAAGTGLAQVSWFTYDTAGGADPDHQRWYTLSGPVITGQPNAALTIYQNTGGNFNAAPTTMGHAVGTATLSFATCSSGQLSYNFTDGTGRMGTMPLTRLTQNVTCSTTAPYPTNPDFAFSGNWYNAATSGQGFTVEINPISGVAFLAWYTYAPNGADAGAAGQRWYTAQGAFTLGMRSIPVTIYETTGGIFDTPTPPSQSTVVVGTGTMAFQNCTAATFNYNFTGGTSNGLSGTIALSRVGPTPPGCTS